MNAADTAFIMICSALVMLMTPGVALFYGGLVRSRNVLSTCMHSFALMGVVPLLWFVVGYSLAFGGDIGGLIGDFSFVMLNGVGLEAGPVENIPHMLFMLFQCMFAVLTIALISGSYAFLLPVAHLGLFTHGALGLGRRLDGKNGRCRLCRRCGGTYGLGSSRSCHSARAWRTHGYGQAIFYTA